MTDAVPTIIDCDPGVDDAIAILMALGNRSMIDLRAITCVAGNVPLSRTSANARRVLDLAGCTDVPVFDGCAHPIMTPEGRTSSAHGSDGLGGVDLPEPVTTIQPEHAIDAINRIARDTPGGIVLCPIGPMTNVALALLRYPDLKEHIRQIVLMGGACFGPGNITPFAEFNFHVDPHAAQIVMNSGIPIMLFGLDVTRQALLNRSFSLDLAASDNLFYQTVGQMLGAYESRDPCLHDPCVIAWLIDPSLFQSVAAHVEITLGKDDAAGQSVARTSAKHLGERHPNCECVTHVDAVGLETLLKRSLEQLVQSGVGRPD
ncbi:nucleoside hydrolase [Thalassorhabdomicrobium marinisediminis]|uniref:nucleoside hydrolase n=1 Tax=Thalassorhabdomicrobium marinisediminis TaxID=2170577 RepID=UPI002493365E|nr:nucleoside hydrolase [Thalassorhabdomicrobium marinisediminis]